MRLWHYNHIRFGEFSCGLDARGRCLGLYLAWGRTEKSVKLRYFTYCSSANDQRLQRAGAAL